MCRRKIKLEFFILIFLFCGFLINPIWLSINSRIVFGEVNSSANQINYDNIPEKQLPSINNLGAPFAFFTEMLV